MHEAHLSLPVLSPFPGRIVREATMGSVSPTPEPHSDQFAARRPGPGVTLRNRIGHDIPCPVPFRFLAYEDALGSYRQKVMPVLVNE